MADPDGILHLPSDSERVAIIGHTGSGKTQAAVWQLSLRNYTTQPWIVFNFKGDGLIDSIPGTFDLGIKDRIPKRPGIYVVRPLPDDKENLDAFLFRVWKQERVGIYADEGYMLTGLKYFRACLTQGRSKRIPMIVLSQRPRWIDRFVWSEADYLQAFSLSQADDKDLVDGMIPGYDDVELPEFWSLWRDVRRRQTLMLRAVPTEEQIRRAFKDRLPNRIRLVA